ncbi:hypothetical protein ABT297_17560 [Dactylosporangium sp. NPDC000555]|uniref:TlpA family protein disulfide reductase n=1 Tax=Dactylosporangium sp. NPDC000555 TaxID=3154260 RepID=UPI003324F864
MTVLIAAVVLVGVLCTVDLALTVGVIRRLREYEVQRTVGGASTSLAPPGTPVGQFAATTVDGGEVTRDALADAGGALVGFFTPHCEPCEQQLPEFVAYAGALSTPVLAVVVGASGDVADLVRALEPVARVVVEEPLGPLAAAFQVRSFPSVITVDGNGRMTAGGHALAAVRQPVPTGR